MILTCLTVAFLSGCSFVPSEIPISHDVGELEAQLAQAEETVRVARLHAKGITGKGIHIFLVAPMKLTRFGANLPVGFYLEQIIKAVAPEAKVTSCDTGGDWFSLSPQKIAGCLWEATVEGADVVVVGVVSWLIPKDWDGRSCDDLVDGRIARQKGLIFAGAGDNSTDGLAYPACISSVTPVIATYDADAAGDLPLLKTCWRQSVDKDEVTCFSNYLYGRELLAAPGAIIQVDFYGVKIPYCCSTAISAVITGAGVALLKEAYPQATDEQILKALHKTGLPVRGERGGATLGRRIDLYQAFLQLGEWLNQDKDKGTGLTQLDENGNCLIDTAELFIALDLWVAGELSTDILYQALDAWVEEQNICEGG